MNSTAWIIRLGVKVKHCNGLRHVSRQWHPLIKFVCASEGRRWSCRKVIQSEVAEHHLPLLHALHCVSHIHISLCVFCPSLPCASYFLSTSADVCSFRQNDTFADFFHCVSLREVKWGRQWTVILKLAFGYAGETGKKKKYCLKSIPARKKIPLKLYSQSHSLTSFHTLVLSVRSDRLVNKINFYLEQNYRLLWIWSFLETKKK